MNGHRLPKEDLARLLAAAGTDEVVLPVDEGQGSAFRSFAPGALSGGLPEGIDLAGGPSHRPAKEVAFPQTDTILTFDLQNSGGQTFTPPPPPPTRIVCGARPCDGRGQVVLDHLLLTERAEEPGYAAARERTLVVGLGCRTAGPECFCTSVGGDPHSTDGLDVLLTDLGRTYHARAITGRGTGWLAGFGLARATASDEDRCREVHEAARQTVPRAVDVGPFPAALDGAFEDRVWDDLAPECIACGICTYLCPTCRCFDIQDEVRGASGRRLRVWDSCMYREYTQEASGHNPRPAPCHRWRNRFCDKFGWIPDEHGIVGCVGCGRCVTDCPAGIDLPSLVERVAGGVGQ